MNEAPKKNGKQVFVSYAHADNQRFDPETPGWVTSLADKLQKAVAMQPGGRHVDFWMDHRLEPQRRVDQTLKDRITESACILSFMSPRYLESEWCQLEMATFVELVGGGESDDRVFLVEVLPTKREHWHRGLQELTEVRFWENSFDKPEAMILGWPAPNPKGDREYWRELNTLAARLARQVMEKAAMEASATPAVSVAIAPIDAEIPSSLSPKAGPLRLIINADKPDRKLGRQTQDLLDELEVEAILAAEPTPDQLPAQYRQNLSEQLEDSHGVIIVYGSAPPSWAQSQYALASKVFAMRQSGIWGGLLDGPPEIKPDHDLPKRRLKVLDCRKGLSPEPLKEFVDILRGNGHV